MSSHTPRRRPGRATERPQRGWRPSWAASRWGSCSPRRTRCSSPRCSPTRSASPCGCSFHDYFFAAPGRRGGPAVRRLGELRSRAVRPGRATVVPQRRPIFLVINVPLTVFCRWCWPPRSTPRSAAAPSCAWPTTSPTSPPASPWSPSGCSCSASDGLVNQVLGPLAPDPSWLVNSTLAMPVIAVFVTWKQLGFFILLYLAALQNVPKELYESAHVDGAGRGRVVPQRHRPRRPAGHDAGGHPGHDHRRQPVHRALPADQRRRTRTAPPRHRCS